MAQSMSYKSTVFGALLATAIAQPASASFIGQTVDFTFSETGFPNELVNGVSVLDPGLELFAGDGSTIGNIIMLTSESIDIGINSITFTIRGDGPAHAQAGYQTTGFGADATYIISGFNVAFDQLFELTPSQNIGIELTNIIGVSFSNGLVIGSDFIALTVGTLGVGQIIGADDIGTITLRAVPLPAALPLMLAGLIGIAGLARKTTRS